MLTLLEESSAGKEVAWKEFPRVWPPSYTEAAAAKAEGS